MLVLVIISRYLSWFYPVDLLFTIDSWLSERESTKFIKVVPSKSDINYSWFLTSIALILGYVQITSLKKLIYSNKKTQT
jgi:hypothetical protein